MFFFRARKGILNESIPVRSSSETLSKIIALPEKDICKRLVASTRGSGGRRPRFFPKDIRFTRVVVQLNIRITEALRHDSISK